MYAYDPELIPRIPALAGVDFTDYKAVRAAESSYGPVLQYEPPTPVVTTDLAVEGPEGAPDVPVRVYRPSGHGDGLPGMLYLHSGGFVAGTVAQVDPVILRISAEVGVVVVSVEYRLAPENPFPAGLDDCYAVLAWAAKYAAELGIDPQRLAVCGHSAGGGLAAALALLARDRGGPAICFQYLGVPEIDDRLDTPSMLAYVDTPIWNRRFAEFSWDSYLGVGKRGSDNVSPYAAPARAEDLSGLPPAFVTACQFDPLRDEDIRYAQRLAQANVPAELIVYPGAIHGTELVEEATIARRMSGDMIATLRRALTAN
ncbi:alpha/beta hydrolase [Kribbella hippodromi]|uniref:Alpha/beta hydrolase n=1 Tax=Kribbella hippodromi TaxID=434347 RepID=A0ABP4NLA4_9ACTN